MADLGAIASNRPLYRVRTLSIWAATNARVLGTSPTVRNISATFSTTPNKALSGVVSNSGSPVLGAVVRLYHRTSGELMAETRSQAGGAFSFGNLAASTADYYLVALGGVENALIYDILTPQ